MAANVIRHGASLVCIFFEFTSQMTCVRTRLTSSVDQEHLVTSRLPRAWVIWRKPSHMCLSLLSPLHNSFPIMILQYSARRTFFKVLVKRRPSSFDFLLSRSAESSQTPRVTLVALPSSSIPAKAITILSAWTGYAVAPSYRNWINSYAAYLLLPWSYTRTWCYSFPAS